MNDFILSPAARQDLSDIWTYIAQDNLDAADRVQEELFNAFQRLVQMPMMGHLWPDLSDKLVRFLGMRNYLTYLPVQYSATRGGSCIERIPRHCFFAERVILRAKQLPLQTY